MINVVFFQVVVASRASKGRHILEYRVNEIQRREEDIGYGIQLIELTCMDF